VGLKKKRREKEKRKTEEEIEETRVILDQRIESQ
jgi:hypothetical protein